MTCRICYEDTNLVSVCGCKGTHRYVHLTCVQQWINVSSNEKCELCLQPFKHKNLKFNLPQHNDHIIFLFTSLIGMIHGIITWLSLFENHNVAILILETILSQFVLNTLVCICKYPARQKWKPLFIFVVAFFIAQLPFLIFVQFQRYAYKMMVPCLLNIVFILGGSYFYCRVVQHLNE